MADRSPANAPALNAADLSGTFSGRVVRVEPLSADQEPGLIRAAADPDMFAWMPTDMASSHEALHDWLASSLVAARQGREVPFAILDARSGTVLSTQR